MTTYLLGRLCSSLVSFGPRLSTQSIQPIRVSARTSGLSVAPERWLWSEGKAEQRSTDFYDRSHTVEQVITALTVDYFKIVCSHPHAKLFFCWHP